MDEFEKWVSNVYPATRVFYGQEAHWMREAWLEATRRADRKAREECAEICEKDFNLFSAAVIRATIKEE